MGNEQDTDKERGMHPRGSQIREKGRAAFAAVGALGENAATSLWHSLLGVLQTRLSFVTSAL